jgi:hypothetical protein
MCRMSCKKTSKHVTCSKVLRCILVLPPKLGTSLRSSVPSFRFPHINPCMHLSSVHAICPTTSLELIILIRNKASHFAVFSNILLLSQYYVQICSSAPQFSNAVSLYSSINITDHILLPYTPTCKILCTSVNVHLLQTEQDELYADEWNLPVADAND